MREQLIDAVENRGEKIKQVAKRLRMNYSSAKSIFQVYKKEGRSNKKVYKRKVHPQENKGEDLASQSIEAKQLQESLKAFQNAQLSRQGFHPFWNNSSQLNSEPTVTENSQSFVFTPKQPLFDTSSAIKMDQMRILQQQQQQQQQMRLQQLKNQSPQVFPQQLNPYSLTKNVLNQNQSQLGGSLIGIGMKDYPANSINLSSQVQSIQPPNFFASINSAVTNSLPHMNLNNIFHQNNSKHFDLHNLQNLQLRRNSLAQPYPSDPFFLQNFAQSTSQVIPPRETLNPFLKSDPNLIFYGQDLVTAKLEPKVEGVKEETLLNYQGLQNSTKIENADL